MSIMSLALMCHFCVYFFIDSLFGRSVYSCQLIILVSYYDCGFCLFLLLFLFVVVLMYFGDPLLNAYILRSIMSSWCSVPFIIMKCPSLSILTFVILRSICQMLSVAIATFCGRYLHRESFFTLLH